jgi:hypothetical protein
MKYIVVGVFFSLSPFFLTAQENDNNITITAKESYLFKEYDQQHPVVIKQLINTSYHCNKYRTTVPVFESYNDQLELNDIQAKKDGDRIKNLNPVHDYYNSDGIFYSDSRICYFPLPLEKKGSTSEVIIQKTVLDPRYFTSIYFTDQFDIDKKEIEIIVPEWMKIELKEYNFANYAISKKRSQQGNSITYTYTITNAPAIKKEKGSPGMSYLAPHILVMCKEAELAKGKITYFKTLDDQYAWYRGLVKQMNNDHQLIKTKATELTKNINTDTAKVKLLFQWIQDNIRYIAFEDGMAGFKPANAQDVLAKKYGDCKGMANLMTEMLRAINLDGRLCWLGTNHIAYDYSTPSLGVDNHMIAAWFYKDKIFYLDPTEKYIGFSEVAERIQGRQVLIENNDKYLLKKIPEAGAIQNTSTEKRKLSIVGNDLKGKVQQVWKGENKEWLLTQLHSTKSDKQESQLIKYLSDGNNDYQISNMKIYNLDDYNSDLKIEYDLTFKNAVTAVGNQLYIDVDNRKDFASMSFDTAARKLPYQFYFKTHLIFETEIEMPGNAAIGSMPGVLKIDNPDYIIRGNYTTGKNSILYQREIQLKNTLLKRNQFAEWNASVGKLNDFYNNQLEISYK